MSRRCLGKLQNRRPWESNIWTIIVYKTGNQTIEDTRTSILWVIEVRESTCHNGRNSRRKRRIETRWMKQQRRIVTNCDYRPFCDARRQIWAYSSLSDWSDPLDLLRPLNRWEGSSVSRRSDSLKNVCKYFSHHPMLTFLFSITLHILSTTDLRFLPERPAPCSEGSESGALALS